MTIRGLPDVLFGKPVTEGIESVVIHPDSSDPTDSEDNQRLDSRIAASSGQDLSRYLTAEYARKERLWRMVSTGNKYCGAVGAIAAIVYGVNGGDETIALCSGWLSGVYTIFAGGFLGLACDDMRQDMKKAQQAYGAGGVP